MKFDTELSPEMEKTYREWMRYIGHTPEKGMAVTDDYTGLDYDYRGFFKKYGPKAIEEGQHFTDEFKKPNHPTFSTESIYSKIGTPMQGGVWMGDSFTPSTLNTLVKLLQTRGKDGK